MSAIPTAIRDAVRIRQGGQCARCGNTYTELHHRQRRRDAGHPVEVMVGLCGTDHRWAHANPTKAKEVGYIVSPYVDDVANVPIRSFMGWVQFTKDGGTVFVDDN